MNNDKEIFCMSRFRTSVGKGDILRLCPYLSMILSYFQHNSIHD